jgi:hypothetical protein
VKLQQQQQPRKHCVSPVMSKVILRVAYEAQMVQVGPLCTCNALCNPVGCVGAIKAVLLAVLHPPVHPNWPMEASTICAVLLAVLAHPKHASPPISKLAAMKL